MGKLEYLDALKRAMLGLPPELQAKTLAYYEQRFVDGAAAGRSEPDVARELDDPRKIAMTLRANTHLAAFADRKNPATLLRMLVSGVGLAIFNLFMIVPALVYSALLCCLYICALAFYLAGIATTASGLAGTNELVLDWPGRFVTIDADDRGRQVRIDIGSRGIVIDAPRAQDTDAPDPDAADDADIPATASARHAHSRALRGAEALADSTLRIRTDMDADSRTTQTLFGFGLVLGGIALFLLALVVTRYTFVGIRRYLQMNRSLLKGG